MEPTTLEQKFEWDVAKECKSTGNLPGNFCGMVSSFMVMIIVLHMDEL
jgi:hypothetical protein